MMPFFGRRITAPAWQPCLLNTRKWQDSEEPPRGVFHNSITRDRRQERSCIGPISSARGFRGPEPESELADQRV